MTKDVDICLLLEGTYPYVRGGVSSWVHQMIQGLPQYRFHLIFLGGSPDAYHEPVYELPDNVTGFEVHFLLSDPGQLTPSPRPGNRKLFAQWARFLSYFEQEKTPIPSELLVAMSAALGKKSKLSMADFLYSRSSWEVLTERYLDASANKSFVDYFWTYRSIYQPLFTLARISQNLPDAKAFHSVSTGYAGFLGALCKQQTRRPLLITEHGIYTKERKIDLSQASWIDDRHSLIDISLHKKMDQTRKTWIRFFEQLGLTAYDQADRIISLFEGNRQRQLSDGASSDKTQVIVNGINLQRFDAAYARRPASPPLVVGLVGRVVPIKDIKSFIRAIRSAVETLPALEGWIIGPAEEDPTYVRECELLIESLGLSDHVKLLGNQDVAEIMPALGVMMLTSISEAQPLVLLEAMASGIPCIATEVGACREMIDGRPGEDAALGAAGTIIPIASPIQGAQAIIDILSDTGQWCLTGDIGRARVRRYYDEKDVYHAYQTLYEEALNGRDWL